MHKKSSPVEMKQFIQQDRKCGLKLHLGVVLMFPGSYIPQIYIAENRKLRNNFHSSVFTWAFVGIHQRLRVGLVLTR